MTSEKIRHKARSNTTKRRRKHDNSVNRSKKKKKKHDDDDDDDDNDRFGSSNRADASKESSSNKSHHSRVCLGIKPSCQCRQCCAINNEGITNSIVFVSFNDIPIATYRYVSNNTDQRSLHDGGKLHLCGKTSSSASNNEMVHLERTDDP